jgi:hypothetical protein
MNNIFLSGDPVLQPSAGEYQQKLEELKRLQMEMEQARHAAISGQVPGSRQDAAPIWDEIDRFMNELTEREFDFIRNDEAFRKSQSDIAAILQMEYMKLMRPVVERSKEGRTALEGHLTLVRKLKKEASREADNDMMLWKEYTEKHSDMTYKDFLKMKGKKK